MLLENLQFLENKKSIEIEKLRNDLIISEDNRDQLSYELNSVKNKQCDFLNKFKLFYTENFEKLDLIIEKMC